MIWGIFPHATREDTAPPYQVEDPLIQLIASARTPIWFPTNGPLPVPLQDSADAYHRLRGFTFAPLHYEGKLTGFMMLGPRKSGDLYTSDDLDFLAAVAAQSTLALENVRLFTNLRHNLDQTMEMKNLMDNIFASIATGIITTDLDWCITLLNRAAENILGVDVSKVIGKSLVKAVPGFGADLTRAASSTLKDGEPVISTELSNQVPERGDLYLRLSVSPLRDAYLGTKGATLVFEDLTERHKLEAERELIRKTFVTWLRRASATDCWPIPIIFNWMAPSKSSPVICGFIRLLHLIAKSTTLNSLQRSQSISFAGRARDFG